ncbi:MAG: DUF2894 domain-containing protein [Limnohabitans sp.]
MSPPKCPQPDWPALQASLQSAGAARFDPVGWHYIVVLAERTRAQKGAAHALLTDKLAKALDDFKARLDKALPAAEHIDSTSTSPLAALLQDMASPRPAAKAEQPLHSMASSQAAGWRAESPRVQQFRQQLSKISVQRQVTQAMAQAPQNAGPINSHMLVLRSLGLMRDASPDYLNRFMAYVDTLLCLDEATHKKLPAKKSASAAKAGRP